MHITLKQFNIEIFLCLIICITRIFVKLFTLFINYVKNDGNTIQTKMTTCFTETLRVGADATSTTHGLTKTGNKKDLVQDERYLHTVYADNLDIDVKRSNGHIDSLKVALCNAPDT